MGRRKKNPNGKDETVSTNCITNERDLEKRKALINLKKCKDWEAGRKFRYVDHPTLPKTKVRREIK
jgi:hypothetical protein